MQYMQDLTITSQLSPYLHEIAKVAATTIIKLIHVFMDEAIHHHVLPNYKNNTL